jgi:predicted ArsR family transcriptional regulator
MYTYPMSNTQQRILNIIRKNGSTTISTLCLVTGLTKPNIHHHIKILERNNYIEISSNKSTPSTKKGRPENVIHLLPDSCPNNLQNLANQLLSIYFNASKEEGLRNLASSLFGKIHEVLNASQLMNSAIYHFNQANYQAHWEAHEQGPRIMFNNCPYLKILPAHPELCLLDQFGIEILIGQSVKQVTKINLEGGILFCTFIARV